MDIHFNAYKVKYPILDSMIKPIIFSNKISTINIFINLDDFYHKLHKEIVNNEFQVISRESSKQFVSNVFNLIGHYRNWALKLYLKPVVYAYYTSNRRVFSNSVYNPSYRDRFRHINDEDNSVFYYINQCIRNSNDMLRVIARYIPEIYIVDTKYIEPSILPLYISNKNNTDTHNLVISRDPYDLQYSYMERYSVVLPKGERSQLITKDNLYDYISIKNKLDIDNTNRYDVRLYPYIYSIMGDKYRNLPKLRRISYKTIFKYLDTIEEYNSNDLLDLEIAKLNELVEDKNCKMDTVNKNYLCTNIISQVNRLLDTDKAMIDDQIRDMSDYKELQRMNNEIFDKYPLNLNFLCNRIQLL